MNMDETLCIQGFNGGEMGGNLMSGIIAKM